VGVLYSPLILADQLHFGWWKIANGMTAIVEDVASNRVKFSVTYDGGFGQLTQFMNPKPKQDGDYEWWAGKETLPIYG